MRIKGGLSSQKYPHISKKVFFFFKGPQKRNIHTQNPHILPKKNAAVCFFCFIAKLKSTQQKDDDDFPGGGELALGAFFM